MRQQSSVPDGKVHILLAFIVMWQAMFKISISAICALLRFLKYFFSLFVNSPDLLALDVTYPYMPLEKSLIQQILRRKSILEKCEQWRIRNKSMPFKYPGRYI